MGSVVAESEPSLHTPPCFRVPRRCSRFVRRKSSSLASTFALAKVGSAIIDRSSPPVSVSTFQASRRTIFANSESRMEILFRFPLARVRQIRKGPPVDVESRLSVCQTGEKGESFDEEFHGNISNVIICVAHPYAMHAQASNKIFRKKIVAARPRTRRNSRPRQRRFLSYDAVQIIWHAPSGIRFTMFPEPRLVFPSRRYTKRTCSRTYTALFSACYRPFFFYSPFLHFPIDDRNARRVQQSSYRGFARIFPLDVARNEYVVPFPD